MSSIKQQFYAGMKAEFDSDDFTTSFLYRRLAAEKDAEVLRERPTVPMRGDIPKRADPYVFLKTCWMALERGELREEDYLKTALRVLIKNPKLRVGKNFRESLWSYGERLRGGGAFAGMRQNKQRYEALLRILEEGPPAVPFGERALKALHQELLKCALEVDARTFLYDAGFPASAKEAAVPRKKDRLLDMLDAYCEENRYFLQRRTFAGQGASDGQSLDAEQKRRIEAFYRALRDGKSAAFSNVVIPIQIDSFSGAGLYIMGKNNFLNAPDMKRKIKGNCCYICFYLGLIDMDEEVETITFSWLPGEKRPSSDEEESLADMCNFPNLDEALSWYQELLRQKGFRFFQDQNGALPPNCPQELSVYFRGGHTPGRRADIRLDVSQAEKQRAKEEEDAAFEAYWNKRAKR